MRIYIFSPIPYSFLHQRPQKLADQFLARSIPVTYIEPCGLTEYLAGRKKGILQLVFVSAWYHCIGLFALIFPHLGAKPAARQRVASTDPPGMEILSMPFVIPNNRVDSPLMEKLNCAIYRQVLKRRIFRKMSDDGMSYAIVENPFWGFVLRKGDFTKIAYDCIDEISLFSGKGSAGRFEQYERDLLDICSAVFVTAEKLEDRLRPLVSTIPWFACRTALITISFRNVRQKEGFQETFKRCAGRSSATSECCATGLITILLDSWPRKCPM